MENVSLMKKIRIFVSLVICVLITAYYYGRSYWVPVLNELKDRKTISEVVALYEKDSELRLKPFFNKLGLNYPPEEIAFLAVKQDKILELWVSDAVKGWCFIRKYPILAASGELGPKLREGDHQVPEGIYNIEYFNPNSSYHLSMKLDYPNAFDQKCATKEDRDNPGSDIFIHGKNISVGCLAMGDPAIEELFVLAVKVGKENVKTIISPVDPRKVKLIKPEHSSSWVNELYENITHEFIAVSGTTQSILK